METLNFLFIFAAFFMLVNGFSINQKELSPFIVNGRDADIADFPHHLGLLDRGRFFCGAAVISPQFALSAAHCLDMNTPPELLNLVGGSTSRITGHVFFVDSYNLHPQYRRIQLSTRQIIWDYDVAIMQVAGNLLQGFPNIEPSVLPQVCSDACCGVCVGTEVKLAGWVNNLFSNHCEK